MGNDMKMIVGLGNPGQQYVGPRHNIGFEVLGRLSQKVCAPPPKAKFQGEFTEIQLRTEKIILLCPLTFMNLSGQCVSQAANFYRIDPVDILVVCDDFNLSLDRLRFRASGSSGGQNGLNDIINRLGTQDFPRLRIGIGPVPERWNPADFVLGKFHREDLDRVDSTVDRCVKAIEEFVEFGIGHCMNQYNRGSESRNKKNVSNSTESPKSKGDSGD